MDQFSRTRMLLGPEGMERLKSSRVIIFGVGGVGGYVTEALARSGVGTLTLVDNDTVSLTNLNRQIIALHSTIGRFKTEVMAERIHDINPECRVETMNMFYLPENADNLELTDFDYVVDAIDTVSAKLELAARCFRSNIPEIAALGAGNKLDPTKLLISDISKTHTCPLAKVMRIECRKRGIDCLKVAWSTEPAMTPQESEETSEKRRLPGSTAFVPSAMGLLIAS